MEEGGVMPPLLLIHDKHDCVIFYAIVYIYQVNNIRFLGEKARKEVIWDL